LLQHFKDFGWILATLKKKIMLTLCAKYLSPIFMMTYENITSVKAQQLCTRWTHYDVPDSDMYLEVVALSTDHSGSCFAVLLVLLPECQAWYFWFQKFIMAISIKT
jgi:hypothetical protein